MVNLRKLLAPILVPFTMLAYSNANAIDEKAKVPDREYEVSRHYEEPTYGVDILSHIGKKKGVTVEGERKLYRSIDGKMEVDGSVKVSTDNFDLDTDTGEEKYKMLETKVSFDGIYKREIDTDLGKIMPYLTIEPHLSFSAFDVDVDYGDKSIDETVFYMTPGIFGTVFLDREELGLVKDGAKKVNNHEFGSLIKYLKFGMGIEKQISFHDSDYPDSVRELQELENDPLKLTTRVGLDDAFLLEYLRLFGDEDDHNEVWLRYFPRVAVKDLNTINSIGLGYDDDYGKRDIIGVELTSYFLRPEVRHDPGYHSMDVGYLLRMDMGVDSEGGGKLMSRIPFTDDMIRVFLFSEQLGLKDGNKINHQNQLELIVGFKRFTYANAEDLDSLYLGFGWDYKKPYTVNKFQVDVRDNNE
ncbi:MAG: hypothetical protein ACLFP2_03345 [Candidatus Woesearchaeota archaeon]